MLKTVGYNPEEVAFVPIASLPGDNVFKKSDKLSWWSGKTLMEQMDEIKQPEKLMILGVFLTLYLVMFFAQKAGYNVDEQSKGVVLGILLAGSKEWFDGKPDKKI